MKSNSEYKNFAPVLKDFPKRTKPLTKKRNDVSYIKIIDVFSFAACHHSTTTKVGSNRILEYYFYPKKFRF